MAFTVIEHGMCNSEHRMSHILTICSYHMTRYTDFIDPVDTKQLTSTYVMNHIGTT